MCLLADVLEFRTKEEIGRERFKEIAAKLIDRGGVLMFIAFHPNDDAEQRGIDRDQKSRQQVGTLHQRRLPCLGPARDQSRGTGAGAGDQGE